MNRDGKKVYTRHAHEQVITVATVGQPTGDVWFGSYSGVVLSKK